MVVITNAPIGHPFTGVVRAGDPTPAEQGYVTLAYPYPQGDSPTYLSVDSMGHISASPTVGGNELFQESTPKGFLECERGGPLVFGVTYGLS